MITLKNQYVLKLDIAHFKDFVSVVDFIDLVYIEDSAMRLPTIEISFILRDEKIIAYLNEGSILTVGIGKDELSMLDLRFRVIGDYTTKRPTVGSKVKLQGIHDDFNFSEKRQIESYRLQSSLDVVKKVSKKYFPTFKTNLDKTNDTRNWQQHSDSWSFLRNVCAQGFLNSNTFLVGGFDNDTFYYYDFKQKFKHATENPSSVTVFSKIKTGGNIINYNSSNVISTPGATSRVLGYDSINIEYNWLDYTVSTYSDNLLSFTSLDTAKLPIIDGYKRTNYRNSFGQSSSNTALTHNAKNMILNGNTLIFISFGGQFKKLKIFDIVMIDETGDKRINGLSMVSRIAYQIVNNQLYTNITLVRESINGLKGESLQ